MYLLLLPFLLVFAVAEPPAALRSAGKEVVIQDREILIPHVPESVEQAHAEYSKVRPMIRNGINDLEKEITQLLEIDRKNEKILISIRVLSSEAEAARFYTKMLNDGQYTKLQITAISAWNEWQSVLMDAGLATCDVPIYRKADKSKNDDSDTKLRLSRQKKMSDAFLESERELNSDLATNPISGEFDPKAGRF
ncbi:MAG: hypothetical protein Q8O00_06315, partial [Holophaga sp.]|nr:hypothetical protein [Holophaga sp.]